MRVQFVVLQLVMGHTDFTLAMRLVIVLPGAVIALTILQMISGKPVGVVIVDGMHLKV